MSGEHTWQPAPPPASGRSRAVEARSRARKRSRRKDDRPVATLQTIVDKVWVPQVTCAPHRAPGNAGFPGLWRLRAKRGLSSICGPRPRAFPPHAVALRGRPFRRDGARAPDICAPFPRDPPSIGSRFRFGRRSASPCARSSRSRAFTGRPRAGAAFVPPPDDPPRGPTPSPRPPPRRTISWCPS